MCDEATDTCVHPYCDAFTPFCGLVSTLGIRARQMCPLTCGCDDPKSPLALFLRSYATYLKFQAQEANRQLGDDVRLLKMELDRLKEEHAREWIARGQTRVQERKARQKQRLRPRHYY